MHKNQVESDIRMHELADVLERMTPAARQVFRSHIVDPYLRTGEKPVRILEEWMARDYIRKPVGIEQFIYDKYYLGGRLADSIYPQVVKDLVELYTGAYTEVVLTGGIGTGKTTFVDISNAYEIYCLSCLRDPTRAYGMVPGTVLTFLHVSVDRTQARNVLFQGLVSLVDASPYFLECFPIRRNVRSELQFVRDGQLIVRCCAVAARARAQLGVAVFSAAIDEINFFDVTEHSRRARPGDRGPFDQAASIYNLLSQRLRSRLNVRGRLPGKLYAISSTQYGEDFTERKEREARDNPLIFYRRWAPWDVKPKTTFSTNADGSLRTFRLDLGDTARRPRVLEGNEKDVDETRVIEVPIDFLPEFKRNIDDAVRNIAGQSVLAVTPFIPNREAIDHVFELGATAGLRHPFNKVDEKGLPLDVTLQGSAGEVERLVPGNLHWTSRPMTDGAGRPIYCPDAPMIAKLEHCLYPVLYFAHVDLSRTRDATGLAIGHVIGTKKVVRSDKDYNPITETLPIIRLDLVLRIVAPSRGEIDVAKVRALFYELRDRHGMQFGLITYDSFASQESIKNLKDNGFSCENFSVDLDFTAFDMLKQAIYDGRLLCYRHPKLQEELVRLERTAKKVDHPSAPGSSKDLADCVAAVVRHSEVGWAKGYGNRLFKIGSE
jgi:hypothetical protein